MKSRFILLFVLGALVLSCMGTAETIGLETDSERHSKEMKVLEEHLLRIQEAAAKAERITLQIDEITDMSGSHPRSRCLRYALEGALLERKREIVGSLKGNPHDMRYSAKRDPIFESWSPSLEIEAIPSFKTFYTPDGKSSKAYINYCILVDRIGPDATSLYYLDAKKTSELRQIFRMIWKRKTGQEPPAAWQTIM